MSSGTRAKKRKRVNLTVAQKFELIRHIVGNYRELAKPMFLPTLIH